MCQLTYANLNDCYLNSLAIYTLGTIGSEKHDDGCGFICSDNAVWKTKLAAKNITNLGNILNVNIIDDKPIPFHIRSATWGIEVTDENAHPFKGKHFILMHNGTLLPRNGEEPKDKKHDSDSLRFLNTLDECKDINPKGSFEELLNAAMNNFAGKFAFIIREIETNVDYIVRGKTAELYISYVSMDKVKRGFIINTSKETMNSAFMRFCNIWDIFYTEALEFTEPVLLEQESIFTVKDLDIVKVGDCKEFTPVKVESKVNNNVALSGHRNSWWNGMFDDKDDEVKDIIKKSVKIYEFLKDHNLGILDFQLIIMVSDGLSILELTEEDLDTFINDRIPKLSANKKVKAAVKSILGDSCFPTEMYDKYNLEYPWTVNDGNVVLNALNDYYKKG